MAVFSVVFDGTRVNAADATTGWTSDTATVGTETDFWYQGGISISAQVKTSENGFYYTSTSQAMSTNSRTALLKVIATNKDVLDGNGIVIRIGSGTGAYYQYNNVFSAATYPISGGFQIVPINPNISQWRSSTTGSPNLALVTYWAFRADFSATSRAQNFASDAIDWVNNGAGLTGTGGDGADPDGTFAAFVTADEGTSANRWGVVQSLNGILYVRGVLTIGSSGVATVFTDANKVLVFPDGRVTTGFCGVDYNIENAGSTISATNIFYEGRGALFTADDTRPDYTVVGSAGTGVTVSGSTFSTFRQIDWSSKTTALNCQYLNGLLVVGAGADMENSIFSGCTGAADSSYLSWNVATDPDGRLDGSSFTKGSTATHAILFGTSSPTTMTLRGLSFSGYNASNNVNDSTLNFARTTGTVTVNLVGCSGTISYKTAGATIVFVVDPVTTAVSVVDATSGAAVQNARVLLRASAGTGPLPYLKSTTITRSGSTATATATAHGLLTNDYAVIKGSDQTEYNGVVQVTKLTDDTFSYTVSGTPVTPATGTITTTGVALYGVTDSGGLLSTSRSYSSNQPIAGEARRATVADGTLYKPQPVTGTISSTSGFSATVQLIRDQ